MDYGQWVERLEAQVDRLSGITEVAQRRQTRMIWLMIGIPLGVTTISLLVNALR